MSVCVCMYLWVIDQIGAKWGYELKVSLKLHISWESLFSTGVPYITAAEMSFHLCVWLFRNLSSLSACSQRHVFLYGQQFRQINLDPRLWNFRQNKTHVLYRLLNKSWSRGYCQGTRKLWKHKALQKYMEGLNDEYQSLDQCLQDISEDEGDRRASHRRHAELAPLVAVYQEIQEAEQAIEELESMCKSEWKICMRTQVQHWLKFELCLFKSLQISSVLVRRGPYTTPLMFGKFQLQRVCFSWCLPRGLESRRLDNLIGFDLLSTVLHTGTQNGGSSSIEGVMWQSICVLCTLQPGDLYMISVRHHTRS